MCKINEELMKRVISLTDNLAQLDSIIQKLDALSDDFCYNYLERFDISADKVSAKHEIKLIRTMAEVIRDYCSEAAKLSFRLPDIAENVLENIRSN